MTRILRAFLAVAVVMPAGLSAQSASRTAAAFLQANTGKQWLAMADFVDPASLRALREMADKTIRDMAVATKPETRAVMDSMGMAGVGRALDGVQSMLGGASVLQFTFAHVTADSEIATLSDRELMARWFEAKDPSYGGALLASTFMKGLTEKLPPSAGAEMQSQMDKIWSHRASWVVVGEVAESDSVTHVVYRIAGSTFSASTGVLTLWLAGGRWYLRYRNPDDQFGALAALAGTAMQAAVKAR